MSPAEMSHRDLTDTLRKQASFLDPTSYNHILMNEAADRVEKIYFTQTDPEVYSLAIDWISDIINATAKLKNLNPKSMEALKFCYESVRNEGYKEKFVFRPEDLSYSDALDAYIYALYHGRPDNRFKQFTEVVNEAVQQEVRCLSDRTGREIGKATVHKMIKQLKQLREEENK